MELAAELNPGEYKKCIGKNLTSYLFWFSFFVPSRLVASDEIIFSLMTKSNAESGLNKICLFCKQF